MPADLDVTLPNLQRDVPLTVASKRFAADDLARALQFTLKQVFGDVQSSGCTGNLIVAWRDGRAA